jgi:type II secretion system protein H
MTLIEIMVVLLLISLTTALATGAVRSWQNDGNEIDRLALVLDAAAERARVRGTPIRFEPMRHGYRFSHLDTAGNWQTITAEPMFVERALPTDITLQRVLRDGQEVTDGLVFGSDVTLFSVEILSRNGVTRLDGQVSGTLKKISPEPA